MDSNQGHAADDVSLPKRSSAMADGMLQAALNRHARQRLESVIADLPRGVPLPASQYRIASAALHFFNAAHCCFEQGVLRGGHTEGVIELLRHHQFGQVRVDQAFERSAEMLLHGLP